MPTKLNIHAAALGMECNFMACGAERSPQSKRRTGRPDEVTCEKCREAVQLLTLHNLITLHPTTGFFWPKRTADVLIKLLREHGLFTFPKRWTTPISPRR